MRSLLRRSVITLLTALFLLGVAPTASSGEFCGQIRPFSPLETITVCVPVP